MILFLPSGYSVSSIFQLLWSKRGADTTGAADKVRQHFFQMVKLGEVIFFSVNYQHLSKVEVDNL